MTSEPDNDYEIPPEPADDSDPSSMPQPPQFPFIKPLDMDSY